MGVHFGNLGSKVKNRLSYTISPFEQRAFAGVVTKGIPNMFARFRSKFFIVAPPFVLGYLLFDYGEKENRRLARKGEV